MVNGSVRNRILTAVDSDEVVQTLVNLIRHNSVTGQKTRCFYALMAAELLGAR